MKKYKEVINMTLFRKILLLLPVLVSIPLYADDVDIYFGNELVEDDVNPNVLFILDTSGSMNEVDIPEYNPSRVYYDPSDPDNDDDYFYLYDESRGEGNYFTGIKIKRDRFEPKIGRAHV